MQTRPKLLLHVCCGPCATAVLERLRERFDVTCYWHNPNVEPEEEHARRLAVARRVAQLTGVSLEEGDYDNHAWKSVVAGLEHEPEGGRRCTVCFQSRLQRAASFARDHGFSHLACTLTVSPHKSALLINALGVEIASEHQLEFVAEDFKAGNGFKRSVELSKEMQLYRQKYCGCLYARDQQAKPRS